MTITYTLTKQDVRDFEKARSVLGGRRWKKALLASVLFLIPVYLTVVSLVCNTLTRDPVIAVGVLLTFASLLTLALYQVRIGVHATVHAALSRSVGRKFTYRFEPGELYSQSEGTWVDEAFREMTYAITTKRGVLFYLNDLRWCWIPTRAISSRDEFVHNFVNGRIPTIIQA